MSTLGLIKKSAWDVPLEEFQRRILKEVYVNSRIPQEIHSEIQGINDLLVHSYYNSSFIDDAYIKAIFILEKVLRIRSMELQNGKEKASLARLFQWFFDNNYFETSEITDLHQLRRIRNRKVHDAEIFTGSLNFLINIYSIFDLMNDVYEDVPLRLERIAKKKELNAQFNDLYGNGFILAYNGLSYIGHAVSVLFLNNKVDLNILYLRVARCIESTVATIGADRDTFHVASWDFEGNQFVGRLQTGDSIVLKPLIDRMHLEQYQHWRHTNPLWILDLFDGLEKSCYEERLREFYKTGGYAQSKIVNRLPI